MDHFNYQSTEIQDPESNCKIKSQMLWVEQLAVTEIVKQYGTPCYIYSRATLERHWNAFNNALIGKNHLICYAVKANSNIAILNLLAKLGSGFDIVSQGELERVLVAKGDPKKIVFSGVAKSKQEMQRALEVGIKCFNVESRTELETLNAVATSMGVQAPISLRINPDVDAKTHPYISTGLKENKFGIAYEEALETYRYATQLSHIKILGIDCHIGSQLTELAPFVDATRRLLQLIDQLQVEGITLTHLDLGGGVGICYRNETPPLPDAYVNIILAELERYSHLELIFEPGRAIVGNAGILVTTVENIKKNEMKNFALVDAGMNDLIRPTLYDAWQAIIPVILNDEEPLIYDVVGPVCETGDFLGKERPLSIKRGDLLAIRSAGAYGFSMASNYNSRPRCAEIIVDQSTSYLIRQRETFESLWQFETVIEEP